MKLKQFPLLGTLAAFSACATVLSGTYAAAQNTEQEQQGMEVLTRGPVHEAFAETISYDPKPGIIVDKAPPTAIEEIPPDQQPVGTNVSWIPGYWAWDDEQGDFLWISGIWRNLPPGRQWVPGYWSELSNQYQWTSGYWADSNTEEVTYLPEPPATLEEGPSVAAASNDESWVPGNWMWNEERYAWRPGYWQQPQTNWVWIPSRYIWTHRGYVYVDGYWDYAVPRRGVLFAPVHFAPDHYSRPGFSYSPITVISLSIFSNYLFVRPNYGHYYFGDYYEPRYRDRGYYAPFAFNSGRRGYDPIFAYDRWRNRNDRGWENRIRQDFDFRRDNENARPPRTWAALRNLPRDDKDPRRNFGFASPLSQYVKDRKDGPGFRKVGDDDRQKLVAQRQQMQRFSQERQKLEFVKRAPDGDKAGPRKDVDRMKFDRSPIVGRPTDKFGKGEGPPKRPVARKIDPKLTPGGPDAIPGRDGRGDGRPGPDTDRDDKRGPNRPDGATPGDKTRPDRSPQDGVKPDRDGPKRPDGATPGDKTRPDRSPQDGVKPDRDGPKRPDGATPGDKTRPDRVPQDGVKPDRDGPKRPDGDTPADRVRPDRKPDPTVNPDKPGKGQSDRGRNADRPEPSKGEAAPPRRPEPQPTPKVNPEKRERAERPEPKVQPQPKPQPRPEPKAQPQPRPQPRPEPKAQPQERPQPRPEPKAQPQRQQPQQQQARPAPQPAPQKGGGGGGGGGGGKGRDKDKDKE